jgi:aerobic C4-dicarboxylate transport protein
MAPRFYTTLYFRVLVAIVLGIGFGAVAPGVAAKVQPLADLFINLVKMTIAPLIFCTVVIGIASMKSMKSVGKAGGLALLYFEIASSIALVIGLVVVNVVKPGAGVELRVSEVALAEAAKFTEAHPMKHTGDFLLEIVPKTLLGGLANGELLQVLLLALLFGFALHGVGERGAPVLEFLERISEVIFKIVGMVMQLAPIGAFGAMAAVIGGQGLGTLVSLGELMLCFYGTCLLFIVGVLGLVARLSGFSIFRFIRYIKDELFIVLGTSSSETVLPRMMAKLEKLGASKPVVGLVVPAGYSFNLDGTSIYLTMGAMFVLQATHTDLGLTDQLALLGLMLLTSKGAAGVSGSGFIVLAATLGTFGQTPTIALAMIFGIDRFMSEARALTNVIGNGVATLVVAKWCKERDDARLTAELQPR